jgi:DMSO/TMAO reductase YedYZ heme-binding membrane subunit
MSSTVYWYMTRASGVVALLLLTATTVLGVVDARRWSGLRWPRFVIDGLHRNLAMLSVVFLAIHVVTSVLDSFAPISIVDAFIPFLSAYRPLWLGLGAVALDLMVAVWVTSLLRDRLGLRAWRAVHWLAYACWPIALVHTLGTGSDVNGGWMLALSLACLVLVFAAAVVRTLTALGFTDPRRTLALGSLVGFGVFLAVWLPSGPLGSEWARRSGTPTHLLAHASARSAEEAELFSPRISE